MSEEIAVRLPFSKWTTVSPDASFRSIIKPVVDPTTIASNSFIPCKSYTDADVMVQFDEDAAIIPNQWYEAIVQNIPQPPGTLPHFTAVIALPCLGTTFDPKKYAQLVDFMDQDAAFFSPSTPFRQAQ